jgi:hypothetical protein
MIAKEDGVWEVLDWPTARAIAAVAKVRQAIIVLGFTNCVLKFYKLAGLRHPNVWTILFAKVPGVEKGARDRRWCAAFFLPVSYVKPEKSPFFRDRKTFF